MHACMYACMDVYVCVMYVYVCVCIFTYVYVCLCTFMYVYVRLCTFMYVYVCLCMFMCVYVCLCMFMLFMYDYVVYVCLCMILYDYAWLCMIVYDYVWLCMILYHYLWLCMIMYVDIWLCIIMYDYVWLCIIMYDYERLCMILYVYVWFLCMIMYDYYVPIGSMYGIYANIWGILMVHVTIYSIHGSYGVWLCLRTENRARKTHVLGVGWGGGACQRSLYFVHYNVLRCKDLWDRCYVTCFFATLLFVAAMTVKSHKTRFNFFQVFKSSNQHGTVVKSPFLDTMCTPMSTVSGPAGWLCRYVGM